MFWLRYFFPSSFLECVTYQLQIGYYRLHWNKPDNIVERTFLTCILCLLNAALVFLVTQKAWLFCYVNT